MPMDPKDLWATLPPALQRQIVDAVAAVWAVKIVDGAAGVLGKKSHEVRAGQADAPGATSGCLHQAIDAPPGRDQPREPEVAVRASAKGDRTWLARGRYRHHRF